MPLSPQITITPVPIVTKNFDISAVSYTSSTATYTATGHTFAVGDTVLVSDLVPAGYNGTFTVTAIATNTFTVANTTNAAVTDAAGNAFWVDPTEYSYENVGTTFLTTNTDLLDPSLNTALDKANQALADAATAYTAAVNSLQASAYAIQNPTTKQLTAIDATGLTVYVNSPTTGARVVLNSGGLAGYNAGGTATFSISASTGAAVFSGSVTGSTITGGTLNINGNAIIDASGYLTATGATITGTVYASAGTIGGFTLASTYLSGSGGFTLYANGTIDGGNSNTLYYGYVNVGGGFPSGARFQVNGNSEFTGTVIATGSITAQGELYAAGHGTTTNAANGYVFTTGGRIARSTASSQRYKENIVNLVDVDELNPRRLLDLPVRAFSYKEGHLSPTDDRYGQLLPGFIAEEVDAVYPIAADYVDGAESWNDRMIVPALLALIQDQEARIKALEGK